MALFLLLNYVLLLGMMIADLCHSPATMILCVVHVHPFQVLFLVGLYAPHASNLHMPPQNYSDGTPIPPVIFSLICALAAGTQAKAERPINDVVLRRSTARLTPSF